MVTGGETAGIIRRPKIMPEKERRRTPTQMLMPKKLNSHVNAYGYGPVALETPQGLLELPEVWYAPEFDHVKLLSIPTLMREGIEIRFLPDITASAFHNGHLIFTGSMHNGLIYVNTTTTSTTTSQQAYTSEASEGNKQESAYDLIHRDGGI